MQPGTRVGHYEVLEKIGEGGMGAVFRARDARLGRDVAIKQLPPEVAGNPERVARFEREARTLAALQHPHIAALFGFEEAAGERFLVMEIVEGEDLSERLRHGGLGVQEALRIAIQIASGLEEAHAKGIVHRDLKPANVKISHTGDAKILDFGLARARAEDSGPQPDLSRSPTFTAGMTVPGLIMGTAAYMSPEQARGRPVDRTADIWAFGAVLFEMLAGKQLFQGETVSDVMAAILKSDPDWSLLPAGTPPRLREVLEGCLVKDPRHRRRDIGDVRQDLERIASGRAAGATVVGPRRRWLPPAGLAAGLLLGLLLGAGLSGSLFPGARPEGTGPAGLTKLSVRLPRGFQVMDRRVPVLSRDGRSLMILGRMGGEANEPNRLYRRRLDDYALEPVPGSDGIDNLLLSPDGRWLAMLVPMGPTTTRRKLVKAPMDGSTPPVTLLDWPEGWQGLHAWLPNGDIIAQVGEAQLVRLSADGGAPGPPIPVTHDGVIASLYFSKPGNDTLLPDGRHILATMETWSGTGWAQHVVIVDLETGAVRIVVENGSSARWWPTGHILMSRETTVLAVPFDPHRLTVTGGPRAVADGLRIYATWVNGQFAVSGTGSLAYLPGGVVGGRQRLVWMDSALNELGPWSEERYTIEMGPTISADGRRLAMVIAGSDGLFDIWTSEVQRPSLTRLVEIPGADCTTGAWSRDGERLAYVVRHRSHAEIHVVRADGTGSPELLLKMDPAGRTFDPEAFTSAGDRLILTRMEAGRADLVTLPAALPASGQPAEPALLLRDAADPSLSPDGRWLAYESSSTGRDEVYVRRIDPDLTLGPQFRVSSEGGSSPGWYRPGPGRPMNINYMLDNRILAVTITTGPEITLSRPKQIADLSKHPDWQDAGSLPDGRVLMRIAGEEEAPPTSIDVVLGWGDELSRLLAAGRAGE